MLGLERPRPTPRDPAIRDAEINIWRAPSIARLVLRISRGTKQVDTPNSVLSFRN